MSGAARVKNQADWDLERCFEMFDEALISKDERVINALRSLLMIVALTAPESDEQRIDGRRGPLRQLVGDHNNLVRSLNRLEDELQQLRNSLQRSGGGDLDRHNWPYTHGGGYGGETPPYGGGYGGGKLVQSDSTAKNVGASGVTSFNIKLAHAMDDAKVDMLAKLYPELKNDDKT